MRKALTILQPWAALAATGMKRCETRSWNTNYRGEFLIHAGKSDPLAITGGRYSNMIWEPLRSAIDELVHKESGIIFGAIIGKANLVNCVRIDKAIEEIIREQHPDEYAFGDFTPGRYAWVLENPVLFDEPIPASGKQGFWNWEGGICRNEKGKSSVTGKRTGAKWTEQYCNICGGQLNTWDLRLSKTLAYKIPVCEECISKEYDMDVDAFRERMEDFFGMRPCVGI